MNITQMKSKNIIKPIKAWGVVRGGKLDVFEIYEDKDVELSSNERLIRVTITADENTKPTQKKIR